MKTCNLFVHSVQKLDINQTHK